MLIILLGKNGSGKHTVMFELVEKYRYLPFISQDDEKIKEGKYVAVMDPNKAQRFISNRNRDNIVIAYISVSKDIRKKRIVRKDPAVKILWESLTEMEDNNFSRKSVEDMIDITIYNDGRLQDTVSTLLYKADRRNS